jgi:hypothetical protein
MDFKIPTIKQCLLHHLTDLELNQKQQIELNLITFSYQILDLHVQIEKENVKKALNEVKAEGQSAFYDVIAEILTSVNLRFQNERELNELNSKVIVLIFSDGKDNLSIHNNAFSLNQQLKNIKGSLRSNQAIECMIIGGASIKMNNFQIIDLDENSERKYEEELTNTFRFLKSQSIIND